VRPSIRGLSAIFGSALVAVLLCGSTWRPSAITTANPASPAELALFHEGRRLATAGEYSRATAVFRSAALRAEREGSPYYAAWSWNNAGGAALARLDFRAALPWFLKARQIAEASRQRLPYLVTMNNLASLYLEMGDPEAAMRVAKEALSTRRAEEPGDQDTGAWSKLNYQLATALARLHRFDEAEPIYRRAVNELAARDDLDSTARMLGNFGSDCLEAGRLDEAEDALSEALRLVRLHRLNASANILRALAKLKTRQGDRRSAAALFDAAVQAPPGISAQWEIYADRGEFRLGGNDLAGALEDFRAARRIASQMRADIVPADQDRITLEGSLSRTASGLVDAGNRLAEQSSNKALLRETFDAAEQYRLWSLRALIPAPNDWRTRLPNTYWDLLARYQNVERSLLANTSPELRKQASALQAELQHIEAAAAQEDPGDASHSNSAPAGESAFAHASTVLDADSVLLSFHLTKSAGWLWAVDRRGVDVYSIPPLDTLKASVVDFAHATQNGAPRAEDLGRRLYKLLFEHVAARYLSHKRWLLELDGPLFDVPFGALVVDQVDQGKAEERKNEPVYLFERTALQAIPGALMLEARTPFGSGPFLGIGDPIYNAADTRYRGSRTGRGVALARLPATAAELESCSRAWRPGGARLLTGANAGLPMVRAALRSNPSVIHFATHVVSGPGDYSSGLIALSLDGSGAMGLLGPAEIVAHPIAPSLVVLNGCHSGQGEALPGTGLMGLTRAWIGAGARSVVATRWDIPDEAGAAMMVEFYRALRAHPERGPAYALQEAQLRLFGNQDPASRTSRNTAAVWGAYFVLGRE
jgi:CHAT domain-containing protein